MSSYNLQWLLCWNSGLLKVSRGYMRVTTSIYFIIRDSLLFRLCLDFEGHTTERKEPCLDIHIQGSWRQEGFLHTFLDTKPLGLSPSEYQVRACLSAVRGFPSVSSRCDRGRVPGLVLAVGRAILARIQPALSAEQSPLGATIIRHSGHPLWPWHSLGERKMISWIPSLGWCDWLMWLEIE